MKQKLLVVKTLVVTALLLAAFIGLIFWMSPISLAGK